MFVHVVLHRHALHKYALSKDLLLLQSLGGDYMEHFQPGLIFSPG